jgi:hypothetical protein
VWDDDIGDDGVNDILDISGTGGDYYDATYNLLGSSKTVNTDGYSDLERPTFDAELTFEIVRVNM